MLFNVLPCLFKDYETNLSKTYVIISCYSTLGFAVFNALANLSNNIIGQFRLTIYDPAWRFSQAETKGVYGILPFVHILQLVHVVIRFITVNMVNLFSVRTPSNESSGNQYVDRILFMYSIIPSKRQEIVPPAVHERLYDAISWVGMPFNQANNLPIFTNVINILIPNYGSPFDFIHDTIPLLNNFAMSAPFMGVLRLRIGTILPQTEVN